MLLGDDIGIIVCVTGAKVVQSAARDRQLGGKAHGALRALGNHGGRGVDIQGRRCRLDLGNKVVAERNRGIEFLLGLRYRGSGRNNAAADFRRSPIGSDGKEIDVR